jgi:hypothetical protein
VTDVYSIWKGPQYQPLTPNDMMADALNQPMGFLDTLSDQFVGGVVDSPFLGTAIRNNELQPQAPSDLMRRILQQEPDSEFKRAELDRQPISEDAYKASPYYRKDVPYDPRMTEDRAASLAMVYDAKKVREYFASKRPYTSFVGGLAGQAVDPINYIPVAGPLVKGAAVARLGRLGGEIAAASLDAVSNTAVGQIASYPDRIKLGDDITWQSTVSDLAMAGLIGGAFGALHGVASLYREGRTAATLADRQKLVTEQLSTLENTQNARIALNEAIDSVVRGEDVNLSPNAIEPISRIADELNPAFKPYTLGKADRAELFSGTSIDHATDTGPVVKAGFAGLFSQPKVPRPTDTRPVLVQDFEQAIRKQVFDAAPELATRYQAMQEKLNAAQARVDALEQPIAARRPSDAVALVDKDSADRLRAVEDELQGTVPAKRRQQLEAERDAIVESIGPDVLAKAENDFRIGPEKRIKEARKSLSTVRQQFSKVSAQVDTAGKTLMAARRPAFQTRLDTSVAKPEAPPVGIKEAAARVMKAEDTKGLAEQFGVRIDQPKGTKPNESGVEQKTFKTEMGSTYTVDGNSTTRTKAARSTPGHEGDNGLKEPSAKTVYIDSNAAELSAAGLSGLGDKGARVVFKDGKASLLTWNKAENRWGTIAKDVPFHGEPAVGRYPLEVWHPSDDVPGYEAYGKMHAGNKIVEMSSASKLGLNAKASFVEEADIDQLRAEGRLTEQDQAELDDAETTFQNSVAFGEALKTAIACIL